MIWVSRGRSKKEKRSTPQLGFTEAETKISATLVDGDPIGAFLTRKISAEESARIVVGKAQETGLSVADFWDLQQTFYKIDAGGYTADAGGIPSLDGLFDFQPEEGVLAFSPLAQFEIHKIAAVLFDREYNG